MKANMVTGKKKVGIIAVVLLLLVGAVYLNYKLNAETLTETDKDSAVMRIEKEPKNSSNSVEEVSASAGTNYFDSFRQNRENVRNKEIEYLNAIIEDTRTDAETLKDAQEQKIEILNNMEKEFTVESMLIAKGFSDAAVTLHQGSVNVIVDSEPLTAEQAAQILDIVLRETGESAENVKVSAKG